MDTWKEYYKAKASNPPSKVLVDALQYVKNKETALDLGAGGLVDTKFLLQEGFNVAAVDSSPAAAALANEIQDSKFKFYESTYDTFNFLPETYDLVSATI